MATGNRGPSRAGNRLLQLFRQADREQDVYLASQNRRGQVDRGQTVSRVKRLYDRQL